MREHIKIANAFIGVIVGAGFASGQELLLFFVDFGRWGLVGALVSATLFTLLGVALAGLGHRQQATSHKGVIQTLCGRHLGRFVDGLILFFMFGVTVIMLAGAGALLEQQFGLPARIGSVLVTLLLVAVVCLEAQKVILVIGAMTPLLILVSSAIALYAIGTRSQDFTALDQLASQQQPGARHWLLGAFLYVSYNIVVGAPILAILGGSTRKRRSALLGGLLGGAALGGLMVLVSAGLLSRLDSVAASPMPMLWIANEVSPLLGLVMCLIIFGMIVNTAMGTLFAFLSRILPAGTAQFRWGAVAAGGVGFLCSLAGFINLVKQIYPLFGYLGFVLMAAMLLAWIRRGKARPTLET